MQRPGGAKGNAIPVAKQASRSAKIDPLRAAFNVIALMSTNPGTTHPSIFVSRATRSLRFWETDEIFVTYLMQLHEVCSIIYAENEGAGFRCSQTMGTVPNCIGLLCLFSS